MTPARILGESELKDASKKAIIESLQSITTQQFIKKEKLAGNPQNVKERCVSTILIRCVDMCEPLPGIFL